MVPVAAYKMAPLDRAKHVTYLGARAGAGVFSFGAEFVVVTVDTHTPHTQTHTQTNTHTHTHTHTSSTLLRLYFIFPLWSRSPHVKTRQRNAAGIFITHRQRRAVASICDQAYGRPTLSNEKPLVPARSRSSRSDGVHNARPRAKFDERLLVGENRASRPYAWSQMLATALAVRDEDARCAARAVPPASVRPTARCSA